MEFLKVLIIVRNDDFTASLPYFSSPCSNFMLYRWYAKRFLHPDIVSAFEYILIWDEDLGVEHFDGDKYDFHVFSLLKCMYIICNF